MFFRQPNETWHLDEQYIQLILHQATVQEVYCYVFLPTIYLGIAAFFALK
jgi:hypothetical protein